MIRSFVKPDTERVLEIWLAASIKAHDFVEPSFWESKASLIREQYIPMSETYVYEEEGIVNGFISLHENTVAAIFVTPDCQGKGIGSQLLTKAKEIRAQLTLSVYKSNTRSLEFYKKSGFQCKGEQIEEHTGHPELLMEFK